MIIDSHLHFYDIPDKGPGREDEDDHLGFGDIRRNARVVGVDQVVQVTPMAAGYDNSHSFAMAERHPDFVAGVVARLDPMAPGIEESLRALMDHPKMLALRLTLIEDHNTAWLADRTLDGFFTMAQEMGVPIELFAPFRVAEMHETVRRYPGIRWLIDHMGLRYYAGKDNSGAFRQWPELLRLAAEPNAWIKCAYFPEAAKDLESYPFPAAQQRLRELYDAVGSSRLIWGSNFPNVRRACTYDQAVDFIRRECDFLSTADRAAMLGTNLLSYAWR
ncbi:MAG TPA: amidohydrolase family protein [Bordetella sp.]|jgi:predicted TIM-barrel fold metal-dependent hydrolase|nr:amidohydrolase family protein [Bordetella sp.]